MIRTKLIIFLVWKKKTILTLQKAHIFFVAKIYDSILVMQIWFDNSFYEI